MATKFHTLIVEDLTSHPRTVIIEGRVIKVSVSGEGHTCAAYDILHEFMQSLAAGDFDDIEDQTILQNQAAVALEHARTAKERGYE